MTCQDFEELIALRASGDLTNREARQVESHLNGCASCRQLAADAATSLEWLRSAGAEPVDHASLHQVRVSVMRRLESESGRPGGWLRPLRARWRLVVAAACLALAAGLSWWLQPVKQGPVAATYEAPNVQPQPPGQGSAASETARESLNSAEPEDRMVAHVERGTAKVSPGTAGRSEERASITANETAPTQAELVTATVEDEDGVVSETVMLKIPTSDPKLVIYWVMDNPDQGD